MMCGSRHARRNGGQIFECRRFLWKECTASPVHFVIEKALWNSSCHSGMVRRNQPESRDFEFALMRAT